MDCERKKTSRKKALLGEFLEDRSMEYKKLNNPKKKIQWQNFLKIGGL